MVRGIGTIIIGIYFASIGLGLVKVSNNPEANANFMRKWGRFFLIGGPMLAVGGIVMIVFSI